MRASSEQVVLPQKHKQETSKNGVEFQKRLIDMKKVLEVPVLSLEKSSLYAKRHATSMTPDTASGVLTFTQAAEKLHIERPISN